MPIIIMLATSCRRSGRRCGDENRQYSYLVGVSFGFSWKLQSWIFFALFSFIRHFFVSRRIQSLRSVASTSTATEENSVQGGFASNSCGALDICFAGICGPPFDCENYVN